MTGHELLPLAVLASSLLPGLIIFALPETWIGVRTFLNVFGAIAKLGLVALLLAGVAAGEEYGERRLRELLTTAVAGSPDDIRDAILASAGAFLGAASPRDDLTLVVAKFA